MNELPPNSKAREGGPGGSGSFLLALTAMGLFALACGEKQGPPDGGGGVPDGGVATGQTCPAGDPEGCTQKICLAGMSGQTYCSEYCGVGTCPAGFPCQIYLFGDVDGAPADLRAVCAPACEDGTQCQAGVCEAGGLCESPAAGSVATGGACGASDGVCEQGNVCVEAGGLRQCAKVCSPEDSAFCLDGSFCWAANVPSGGRCWPGGLAAAGENCGSHLECAKGLLCILQNGKSGCRIGCDPSGVGPSCAVGSCLPLQDRPYGFCQG